MSIQGKFKDYASLINPAKTNRSESVDSLSHISIADNKFESYDTDFNDDMDEFAEKGNNLTHSLNFFKAKNGKTVNRYFLA